MRGGERAGEIVRGVESECGAEERDRLQVGGEWAGGGARGGLFGGVTAGCELRKSPRGGGWGGGVAALWVCLRARGAVGGEREVEVGDFGCGGVWGEGLWRQHSGRRLKDVVMMLARPEARG
jgi:hypothetical protein